MKFKGIWIARTLFIMSLIWLLITRFIYYGSLANEYGSDYQLTLVDTISGFTIFDMLALFFVVSMFFLYRCRCGNFTLFGGHD